MHQDLMQHANGFRDTVRLSLVDGTNPGQTPTQTEHPARALTLGEAIQVYKTTYLSTLKDPASTISRLKHLASFAERTLDSLTVLELQQFFNQLAKEYPAQAYEGVKALRHLYKKMGEWQQYQGFSPAEHVKMKKPKPREVFLDEQDMARLWPVLRQQPAEDRLYFSMLLTLFCRSGELNRAKVEEFTFWIDAETGQRCGRWTKAHTKNGRRHVVPLPPELTQELWDYCQTRPRKDSLFLFPGRGDTPRTRISWWNRWSEIRSVAGLDHVHIHDLRRTGSTWAVAASGDLNSVSRGGLQHADLTTTSIYVRPMDHKISAMFTAHERALRAQGATPQPTAIPVSRPLSSPEVSVPAVAAPIEDRPNLVIAATTPTPHDDDDEAEWPG